MIGSIIAVLVPLGLCAFVFFLFMGSFKKSATMRPSAPTLVVQSGLLTVLAILIPLSAVSSPWSRTSGWRWWFLLTVLVSAVVCLLATVYGMTQLQDADSFAYKAYPNIPCWINATWASLLLLAICVVGPILDATGEPGAHSPGTRFAVAHDLPDLHANRQEIETAWGTPAHVSEWGLVYRTKDTVIVFCLDHNDRTQRIIESQGEDVNAVGTLCK
jgi:hypothetical protein